MKALRPILSYLLSGIFALGLCVFIISSLVDNSSFIKIKPKANAAPLREATMANDAISQIRMEVSKTPELRELVAQNMLTPPMPNPVNSNVNQGIVIEGQNKERFDLQFLNEEFTYDPVGKRDPFSPFESPRAVFNSDKPMGPLKPLQKYSIEQLSVQGIIWGVRDPVAMIVAPDNQVYYIKEREKVGKNNGYVAQIREGEIVVVESFLYQGTITSQVKVLPITKKK